MAAMPHLTLATIWTPASDGKPLVYSIELTNAGAEPLSGFKLGVNGPARLDPQTEIEGATLLERLSNHSLLAPPKGFRLEPGATWVIEVRGLSYPLRHWSDGANSAYVVLDDGRSRPRRDAADAFDQFQRAAAEGRCMRFPLPAKVPAPISVIPWPKRVAITGSRPVPLGFDLEPSGDDAMAAAAAFTALTADLFPVEAIVRPAAEGGTAVTLTSKAGPRPRRPTRSPSPRLRSASPRRRAPACSTA